MEGLRLSLSKLPGGIFSILTLVAILWLTLAPKPLGDNPPPLFPGADKLAHALMFGGFLVMMCFDYQRKHHWKRLRPVNVCLFGLISAATGIFIEYVQQMMGYGRGFEYSDMVADCIGVMAAVLVWLWLQGKWATRN